MRKRHPIRRARLVILALAEPFDRAPKPRLLAISPVDFREVLRFDHGVGRGDCTKAGPGGNTGNATFAFPPHSAVDSRSLYVVLHLESGKPPIARPRLLRTGQTGGGRGARTGAEALGHHQAGLEREPPRPLAEGARGHARGAGARPFLSGRRRVLPARGHRANSSACDSENVILGNGSNEIIEFIGHAFLRPGDEVITARHAFAVYPSWPGFSARKSSRCRTPAFGTTWKRWPRPSRRGPGRSSSRIRTTPPGPWSPRTRSTVSWTRVPDHVAVVFDEAYYEFLDDAPDTLKYVREGRENVVVLRTFSKIQGLAGLRIGYGLGAEGIDRRAPENAPAFQRQRHRPDRARWRACWTWSTSARRANDRRRPRLL